MHSFFFCVLNHRYKLLTATIHRYLLKKIFKSILSPPAHKALKPNIRGCVDALIKDNILVTDTLYRRNKTIEMAWIDLRKTFDSPHNSILIDLIQVLLLLKTIKSNLIKVVSLWDSRIQINDETSQKYKISRGIRQGDSLFPLLYCMLTSMIPYCINKNTKELKITMNKNIEISPITVYVDDIKLYSLDKTDLNDKIRLTERLRNNLGMYFNNEKSATIGNGEDNIDILPDFPRIKNDLSYKYLVIQQKFLGNIGEIEKKMLEGTSNFLRSITNMKVSNKVVTTLIKNTLEPRIYYSAMNAYFVGKTTLLVRIGERIDKEIKKFLEDEGRIGKTSMRARLYMSRRSGGLGLTNFKNLMIQAIIGRGNYATKSVDEETRKLSKIHAKTWFSEKHNNNKKSPISTAIAICKKIQLPIKIIETNNSLSYEIEGCNTVKEMDKVVKLHLEREIKNEYKVSKYYEIMSREQYSNETYSYLKSHCSPNLERTIAVAQERQLFLNPETCRICKKEKMSINHVLTSCIVKQTRGLAPHDSVLKLFVNFILSKLKIETFKKSEKARSLPHEGIYLDRPFDKYGLISNRPDLTIIRDGNILVADVAISNIGCIQSQKAWKTKKYSENGMIHYEDRNQEGDKNLL
uniref:Reverse transcriptase domain-containing protein n=1 Tax=Strongyloides papillosus TaxID=174720 RepID=A0A0N5CA66_STREA